MQNRIPRLLPVLLGLSLAPAALEAQQASGPSFEVRLLGAYLRPSLSALEDALGAYRAAESAGAPLGSDARLRRSVARSVSEASGFDGFGGAVELGASLPVGSSEGRRAGLAVQLGYDRVESRYETEFESGTQGFREEGLNLGRVALVPRFTFSTAAFTGGIGASAGLVRVEYRSDAKTEITGESGGVAGPSASFSGDETTWSLGMLAEIKRGLTPRLALLGRAGYEYSPELEIAVTGADIDAAYRDRNTRPYPPVIGYPEADGTMGALAVPVDLSGFRLQMGVEYRVR